MAKAHLALVAHIPNLSTDGVSEGEGRNGSRDRGRGWGSRSRTICVVTTQPNMVHEVGHASQDYKAKYCLQTNKQTNKTY